MVVFVGTAAVLGTIFTESMYGGSAINGRVDDQGFFLGAHGSEIQVSNALFASVLVINMIAVCLGPVFLALPFFNGRAKENQERVTGGAVADSNEPGSE